MHTNRSIKASLTAILGVAALAGPAAAVPADSHTQPDPGSAGKSTITGSRSDAQTAIAPPKANVYVPPSSLLQGTVAPAAPSWPANPQPIQRHVAAASPSSTGFDWDSAGIGAVAGMAALLVSLGAAAGMRRHRRVQPTA